ncbi:uncharacterized protein J7T54_007187 [Emericellopsis cladophorae]|uniref:Uncharacterized protein n=1 Tax=Emericellopsis cladophorae TaxID=2686198 RepID=A0A9P9XUV5_9HYPO|nr:uncharacterized protein J7T54_007187 [Emericellopsis cladophorae]KAI6778141.1 hypothetical protein J7T54_007187 [Emericellopsis cladophorae]
MEGSSNQAPNQGQSVMSPSTPSSYAVNINRKKTRKWVEAKVQNYDGDDWGAPESEDEPDSPEVPLPARRPAPVGGTRLPSESRIPGAGRVPQAPILQQPQAPTKPAYERPEVGISAATDAPVFSEKNEPDNVAAAPTSSQIPEAEQPEAPRVHGDEAIPDPREDLAQDGKRVSVSPQLPNVARLSAFGADMFSSGSELSLPREPVVQEEREPSPAPLSTGPTTAPVAKNHSNTSTDYATEPEQPSASDLPQKNDQDGVPLAAEPGAEAVSSVREHEEGLSTTSSNKVSSEEPKHVRNGTDTATLPPLHIPSPHEASTAPTGSTEPTSGKPTSGILPTEPLHPRKPDYTPSDYEPQQLGRQQTRDSTTSSPLKESDVLSDEIMRSLTPGGLSPHCEHPDEKREPPVPATGRESSYALSAYDDYWNETGDADDDIQRKPTLGAVPEVPAAHETAAGATSVDTKVPEPTSSPPPIVADPAPAYQSVRVSQPPAYEASHASQQFAPMSPESSQPGSDAGMRRRFSWEAEEARAQQPAATPKETTPTAAAPQPATQDNPVPVQAGTGQPAANPVSPTIKLVSGEPSISHQVSLASSSHAPGGPPSPVSDLSNRDATPLAGNGLGQGASPLDVQPPSAARDLTTGDAHAPAAGGVSSQPTLTFREIMNMSSPQDRIAKYEESRSIFANQESGLSNWLAALKEEHAEHANANGSYSGAMAAPPSPANASTAPGPMPSAQQPYYQQYLSANANTPSAGSAPGGSARSRLAGFPMQAQQAAGSAFGGSGNQIGTKGKELMHSAGKMGKGLFSKGKSKLRGTGDKGEHSPPPVDRSPEQPPHQGPSKSDRRMSWAFSLGPKSRENTSSHPVPSSGTAGADTSSAGGDPRLSIHSEPPRLAEPPRLSPMDGGGQGDLWPVTATTTTTTTNERKDAGNDPVSLSQIDVAPALGLRNPPPPNGNEHVAGGPGQQGPDPDPERLPAVEAGQRPLSEADWVLVPRQTTAAQDIVAGSDARVAPCLSPKSVAGQAAAEGSRIGTGMASQSQPDARPDAQRHSSFKGLPPLRRNSSFGLAALIAADEQQQVEAGAPGRDAPAQGGPIAQPHQAPAHQPQPHPHPQTQPYQYQNGTIAHQHADGASPQPIEEASHRSVGVDSNATLVGQESTNHTGHSSISISKEPMRVYQNQQGDQPAPADPNTGAPRQGTSQPQQSPGQPDASPQPPSGWQLEESHLSEPLQVARRRAGTGSSQQQVTTCGSLEKETGGTLPMSPLSPASGPQQQQQQPTPSPHPPRGRSSDVPPSSARRYPELFRPANQPQRDRADSGGQSTSPPTQGLYQTLSQVGPAQHPSWAGLEGSPALSEGRRKSSNIFKGLGDRLSGSKLNERRSSLAEQSTPPNGQQPVGFHASVQAQDPSEQPKKKRSSFLPSLKQRPSHDAVDEPRAGGIHRPATQETMQPPERAQTGTLQSEKKRSLLGSSAGRVSAAHLKYIPGGLPGITRASTSDVAGDSSITTGNDTSSMEPPKKRFSGFADKAAGLAGRLHRPSQELAKPSPSHSTFSPMNQLHQPQPLGAASHQSLPPPHSRPRDRRSTVESTDSQTMVPPSGPDAEGVRQGRRGSSTGAIDHLWGSNRSSSKTRQPEQPGPYAGPPGSLYGDGQVVMGPPGSSQGPAGRGSSMDASSRASRQFIAQTLPARLSPLAQQSAAQGPSSHIEYQPSHAPQDPAAYDNNGRAESPVDAGPSVTGYAGQDEVSKASMVSPVGSVTTEQGHRASVTEDSVNRSLSQRTVEDPQATPTSPVKRLPTPHASVLLSSMAPPSGPGQSSATTLPTEGTAPDDSLIQDGRGPGQQGRTRQDSSLPSSLQFDRNVSLRKPVPQATSIPSRESTPVHTEAVPPSAHDGSPARKRAVSALVQQPGSQPQSPVGFRPSPSPAGHQSSPNPAQQATKLSPPLRAQGHIRPGQVPSQQQQGIPPQSSPFPGQQPVQPTVGSESKLKGWKARMSAMGQPSPQNGQPKPAQSQPGSHRSSPNGDLVLRSKLKGFQHWHSNRLRLTTRTDSTPSRAEVSRGHLLTLVLLNSISNPSSTDMGASMFNNSNTLRILFLGGLDRPIILLLSIDRPNLARHLITQIGQTQQTGMHRDTLVPQQVQSQDQRRHSATTSTPPDHGSFNLPIQGHITPSTTTPARTPDEVPFEAVQQRDSLQRPSALRHDTIMTDGGRSVESGVMGGSGQRLLPPGQPQFGHHLQPQSSNMSLNTQEPSREGSQISSTTPANTTEITRPVSISPDADIVDQHERNAKNLNVDVAKSNKVDEENIYDATPRLHQNRTGASDNSMSGSATSGRKVPVTSVKDAEQAKRDDPPMMELEDTAAARMRTLRLNSQEEKIFYDPEGDVPKMSATSYPGQEWNPYGEPEFGDWKED